MIKGASPGEPELGSTEICQPQYFASMNPSCVNSKYALSVESMACEGLHFLADLSWHPKSVAQIEEPNNSPVGHLNERL